MNMTLRLKRPMSRTHKEKLATPGSMVAVIIRGICGNLNLIVFCVTIVGRKGTICNG